MRRNKYPIKEEIIYLKADANLRLTLFLRVNKSHLINPNFINNITKEGNIVMVKLQDGTQVKVSRRKVIELKENLQKFFR